MEKAYGYEAREGRQGLGIAKQKHILASKSSVPFFEIQWFPNGAFLGILQTEFSTQILLSGSSQ